MAIYCKNKSLCLLVLIGLFSTSMQQGFTHDGIFPPQEATYSFQVNCGDIEGSCDDALDPVELLPWSRLEEINRVIAVAGRNHQNVYRSSRYSPEEKFAVDGEFECQAATWEVGEFNNNTLTMDHSHSCVMWFVVTKGEFRSVTSQEFTNFHTTTITRIPTLCNEPFHEINITEFSCEHVNVPAQMIDPGSHTMSEGDVWNDYRIEVFDEDNYHPGALTFSVSTGPDWVSVDQNTGRISAAPGFKDSGVHTVTINLSDGGTVPIDPLTFSIVVQNVNQDPIIGEQQPFPNGIDEGGIYTFKPNYSDPDTDNDFIKKYEILNKPEWIEFDSADGTVTFNPDYKVVNINNDPNGVTQDDFPFTIQITDSFGASADRIFSIKVIDVNTPPVASLQQSELFVIEAGTSFDFDASSSFDSEEDPLSFNWNFGDGNTIVGGGAQVTNIYNDVGDYTVTLVVSDNRLTSTPVTMGVRVVDFNVEMNAGYPSCDIDPLVESYNPTNNSTNPVNSATGNKFQAELDYAGAGNFPLYFQRYYNSIRPRKAHLGEHWRHNYDRSIQFKNGLVYALRADGSVITFVQVGGVWQPGRSAIELFPHIVQRLEQVTNGWQFIDASDSVELYNTSGALQSITQRGGLSHHLQYYPDGKLQSVSDDFGRSLQFQYYSTNGNLQALTDPANQTIQFEYNNDNLTTVTYQDNSKRTYLYEKAGFPHHLTGIVDENNHRYATWEYFDDGRAKNSTHAGAANNASITYDDIARTTTVTDAKGQARTYHFANINGAMRTSQVDGAACNSCGGHVSNTTFQNGFPDLQTDFNNISTNYHYNARGLIESIVEAQGTDVERTTLTTWHTEYRVPICEIRERSTTIFTYTTSGLLESQTQVDTTDNAEFPTPQSKTCVSISARTSEQMAALNTRIVRYTYFPNGLLHTVDGPRTDISDVITYAYHPNTNNIASIENPLQQVVEFLLFDQHGRVRITKDSNNLLAETIYDLRGRVDQVKRGKGVINNNVINWNVVEAMDYDYDSVGNIDKVTLPDGSFVDYDYDDANRLTDIRDQIANHIHYDLDGLGNRVRTEIRDPDGALRRVSSAVFNTQNRLERITGAPKGADTIVTNYERYDNNGNLEHLRDGEGNLTVYAYDELNRLTTITNALNNNALYQYNDSNNITQIEDYRGLPTIYTYDGLDNLETLNSPDTGITTNNEIDSAGNVTSLTDARNISILKTYDALNRLTFVEYPDGSSAEYQYDNCADGIGKLCFVIDEAGTLELTYDSFGRIQSRIQHIDNNRISLSTEYAYNSSGQLESITLPSGKVVRYNYVSGELDDVSVNGKKVVDNMVFDPFGPVTSWTFPENAGAARYVFDQDGLLENYTRGDGSWINSYFKNGNLHEIISSTDAVNKFTYTYDPINQIDNFQSPNQILNYDFDNNGNLTGKQNGVSFTNVIDPVSNRIMEYGGTPAKTYSYNNIGSITGDGIHTYHYGDHGRLSSIDNELISYRYNGLGQRVSKLGSQAPLTGDANGDGVIDRADTFSVAWQLLEKGLAPGSPDCTADTKVSIQDIVCINNKILGSQSEKPASAKVHFAYDMEGNLLGEYDNNGNAIRELVWIDGVPRILVEGEDFFFIYTDHLNTPRVIVDESATVVWRWISDPFGESAAEEDPDGDGNRLLFNLRFPGQYYDAESGFNYNNFRYYDSSTARYITLDPVGLNDGFNPYMYVGGDPVNYFDIEGLAKKKSKSAEWIDLGFGVVASVLSFFGGDHGGRLVQGLRGATDPKNNTIRLPIDKKRNMKQPDPPNCDTDTGRGKGVGSRNRGKGSGINGVSKRDKFKVPKNKQGMVFKGKSASGIVDPFTVTLEVLKASCYQGNFVHCEIYKDLTDEDLLVF